MNLNFHFSHLNLAIFILSHFSKSENKEDCCLVATWRQKKPRKNLSGNRVTSSELPKMKQSMVGKSLEWETGKSHFGHGTKWHPVDAWAPAVSLDWLEKQNWEELGSENDTSNPLGSWGAGGGNVSFCWRWTTFSENSKSTRTRVSPSRVQSFNFQNWTEPIFLSPHLREASLCLHSLLLPGMRW